MDQKGSNKESKHSRPRYGISIGREARGASGGTERRLMWREEMGNAKRENKENKEKMENLENQSQRILHT